METIRGWYIAMGFFDLDESIIYTHTFEILSQMMLFILSLTNMTPQKNDVDTLSANGKQRNIGTTIKLAYRCLFLVITLV